MKKLIAIGCLTAIILMPMMAEAQATPGLDGLQGVLDSIKATQATLTAQPTVPISNPADNAKNEGISIFGFSTGISWNQVALNLAKTVVNQVVNSTITWANSGFDNNKNPAFVAEPWKYFGNIASGVIGSELDRISNGALCSPFQAQVTLSLRQALRQAYAGTDYTPQCTLTGIVANYKDFVSNFKQGGWDAWFAITQNSANNPYGAFADAQLTIDNKVAASVDSATQEITWGSGFKSQTTCELYNGYPSSQTVTIGGITGPAPSTYNPNFAPGACITPGPIQTPGATIKSHLDAVLPASNWLSQVTTADQFDKLLTALGNGALQRFVFGPQGLLGKASASSNSSGSSSAALTISCEANMTSATTNEDQVTWTAFTNLAGNVATSYIWQGTDGLTSTSSTATIIYTTPGSKTASVIASTTLLDDLGNYIPGTQKSIPATCSGNVQVSQYHQLNVACYPNQTTSYFGLPATWTAVITGGSGQFSRLEWAGDQSVAPGTNKDANKIWPDGLGSDTNDKITVIGNTTTLNHTFLLKDGAAAQSTETIVQTSTAPNATTTTVTLVRPYYQDKDNVDSWSANITVIDKDPTLRTVVSQPCSSPLTLLKK